MRILLTLFLVLATTVCNAQPRARDLGVPFEGEPGPLNAITDVAGVTVGHVTLIEDRADGHKVRTGVTAILPRGRGSLLQPVFAATHILNGAGELTGAAWVEESGMLDGPVMLTNTHSVGTVHQAVISWRVRQGPPDASGYWWSTPVVGEAWDGDLSDINGFHVKPGHVFEALETAASGPVAEGNVGGGTGMICHEFSCGIGTSSRRVTINGRVYTIGALVMANQRIRRTLRIAGVPVGLELPEESDAARKETGSIIIVVATDAPLLPHQLRRVAKRIGLGLARVGSFGSEGSGDSFIAFSTANLPAPGGDSIKSAEYLDNSVLNAALEATVWVTEEAIVNALVAARDMDGEGGYRSRALPHDDLVELLKRYNRWSPPR